MNSKTARANSEIKKKLSEIFLYELKDPRFDSVMTITWVKVSPDFTSCKVGVSVLNKDIEKRNKIIELLTKSSGHIKSRLAEALKLRAVPKLTFILDDGSFYAQQIDSILAELNIPKLPEDKKDAINDKNE